MDKDEAVRILKSDSCINCEISFKIADYIDQQAKRIAKLKEMMQDVLSDCYLSDGMKSEIKRLLAEDVSKNA